MRRIFWVLPLVAIVLLVGLFILRSAPAVSVVPPERGLAVEAVYATGVVEPVNLAKVAPLSPARIERIIKRDGEAVKRGDVLAQLDAREASGRSTELVARRDFLKRELARQETLVQKNFISRQALDRASSDLAQAEAALGSAQRPLAETRLLAPTDGIVLRQDGEPGEMANAGQVLFWIGNPEPLRVTADVDEEDILRVKVDQKVLVKADALPGQATEGKVTEITQKGDAINKNYRVRIALPAGAPFKTGMTTELNIIIRETPDALLVPSKAVSGNKIWLLRDDKASLTEATLGVKGQSKTEVISGLPADARIIADPPPTLQNGDRLRER